MGDRDRAEALSSSLRELLTGVLLIPEERLPQLMIDPYGTLRDAWAVLAPEDRQLLIDHRLEAVPELVGWLIASGKRARPDTPGSLGEPADGARRIVDERERQKAKWSEDHDDDHTAGDLAVNAAILAVAGTDASVDDPDMERDGWGLVEKYNDDLVRRLAIAGALIAAEIDRELRLLAATS